MSRLNDILDAAIDLGFKTYDQNVSGTMTPVGSSAPLSSFVYIAVTRPADVPADALAIVKSTNRQCWLQVISGGSLRLLSFLSSSTTITATITWLYRVS